METQNKPQETQFNNIPNPQPKSKLPIILITLASILLLIFAFVFTFLGAFRQEAQVIETQSSTPDQYADWKEYKDSKNHYSILYPANYTVSTPSYSNGDQVNIIKNEIGIVTGVMISANTSPETCLQENTIGTISISGQKVAKCHDSNGSDEGTYNVYLNNFIFSCTDKEQICDQILSTFVLYKSLPTSTPQSVTYNVYFMNERLDPQVTCTKVFPVKRTLPYTVAVGKAFIDEMLKGPIASEIKDGYTSEIPVGSKLNSLKIENGVAYADFNAKTESGGGSCSMAIRTRQIRETLLQFPTVDNVVLSIDGRTIDIFQP